MNEIDKYIFGDIEEGNVSDLEKTGFKVTDLKSADWCRVRIQAANDRINERVMLAKEYKEKIDEWLAKENGKDEKTIDILSYFLAPWVKDKIALQKARSVNILGCKMGFRKLPVKIEFKEGFDEVGEAKKLNIEIHTKEYVHKKDFKKYIEDTGHIPDCVAYIKGEEKFYITFGGKNEVSSEDNRLEGTDSLPANGAGIPGGTAPDDEEIF